MNFGKYSRKKKIQRINSKTSKITNLVSSSVFKLIIFTVVILGVVGVAGGIGTLNALIDSAPDIDELLNQIEPEGYTTIIYDLEDNEIQQLHGADANRIYVEYDQIPEYLSNSFIAIEDERFRKHNGIDLEGFMRAIVKNLQTMSFSEGASTITQQIIKNNVLGNSVTIERKVQEMYLAVQLEKHLDKDRILELYMNTVNTGAGTNGVQTASHLYFNKDVWDINLAEAAVLASITNNPTRFNPITHPEDNRTRAERVLNKLLEQNLITQAEYDVAYNQDVYSEIQVNNQTINASSDYSYFVDETITQVAKDLSIQKGYTDAQAYNLIYRGGLSIYITQDARMQQIMDDAFMNEENFPPKNEDYAVKLMYSLSIQKDDLTDTFYHEDQFDSREDADAYIQSVKDEYGLTESDFTNNLATENALYIPQPQAAMVVMDYHNGYIKAMAGGRGQKRGNQTFNRATQAKRQPGSTFKILAAYAPALDARGYTLATVIDDVPFFTKLPNGKTYSPKNWYSGYEGLSTARRGIIRSMNILAVRTVADIGVDLAYDYLLNFGFTTLVENDVRNGQSYTDKTLSLPLGGLTDGVTPLELTAAYGAVANGGEYQEPIFYTKILDHDGNVLMTKESAHHQVINEYTSFLLTDAMVDVVSGSGGTGWAANFKNVSMPVAGKTGTTTSTKDLWFAGYTPYYAAAIWMGYDKPQKMRYVRSYHKYIWRDVMEAIHEDLPRKEFEVPEGITRALVCSESGKLAVPGLCTDDPRGSTAYYEYFAPGTVPTEQCDVHKEVLVCTESGMFANEYCPPDTVVRRIVIERPEPLTDPAYTPSILAAIPDHKYELPYSMIGEYCNIHGPNSVTPSTPDGTDQTDADNGNVDSGNAGNETPVPNNSNNGNSNNEAPTTPTTPSETGSTDPDGVPEAPNSNN